MAVKPALLSDKSVYAELRDAGIRHIRSLAGQLWTDHNLHDPGITLLEVLSYAITDLSYRTGLDIENLLHRPQREKELEGRSHPDFFTAAEVLTSHPVTLSDYRKLLLSNRKYVRNAWIIPLKEEAGGDYTGLYKVLVEFKELRLQGQDVSRSILAREVQVNGRPYRMTVEFPSWKQTAWVQPKQDKVRQVRIEQFKSLRTAAKGEKIYAATLAIRYASGQKKKLDVRVTADSAMPVEEIKKQLRRQKEEGFVNLQQERQALVADHMDQIKQALISHRNLCEDFDSFEEAGRQEIVVNADLEVGSDTDIVEALAEMYYQIDRYLDPPVQFKNLDKVLEEGKSVDEIFDGPWYRQFIDIEAIERMDIRDALFCSEFVRLILGINKILGGKRKIYNVTNLTLSNYNEGHLITSNATVCLNLHDKENFKLKPGFQEGVSYFRIYRNGEEVNYEDDLVKIWQGYQSKKYPQVVVTAIREIATDLAVPEGKPVDIETYHSLQNLFPLIYGIGQAGLPATASERRRAQAKQLKAYLLFFEQLLANYLSQLNRVKDLLSVNFSVDQAYYRQALERVPVVRELLSDRYIDFIRARERYNAYEPRTEWTEDDRRKNELLDHLMARFGETFTDYGIYLLTTDGVNPINPVQHYLIHKQQFLQHLPQLSTERFKAINYLTPLIGIPGEYPAIEYNISGLERKLRHLLNIGSWEKYIEIYHERDEDDQLEYRFLLRDDQGKIILSSSAKYYYLQDAVKEIQEFMLYGVSKNYYEKVEAVNGKWFFNLVNRDHEVIARRIEPFDEETGEIDDEIARVATFISEIIQIQQFLLLEHVLLRPRSGGQPANDNLIKEKFNELGIPWREGLFKSANNTADDDQNDDWPFHLTAMFIYYQLSSEDYAPFDSMEYRNYIEKYLYRETPAHLHYDKICWVKVSEETNNEKEVAELLSSHYMWRWILGSQLDDYYVDWASRDLKNRISNICEMSQG